MSRHSRIHILNAVMNSVERYWRFFFHWLLDVSCIEHRRCFNAVVRVVESNAKTLREATHMNCHTKKKVDSPALLKFFKRAPAKKFAVEFKHIKKKQSKLNCGRKYGQSHFDFRKSHNLQLCLSHQKMFLLLHQNALDLLAYRREIWDTMLPLKALFLRVWTNDHQNFELRVFDIFENWRRMIFQC